MSCCSSFYAAADYSTDNFYCFNANGVGDNDDNNVGGDDNWTTSTVVGKQSFGEHKATELFIYCDDDCCCLHFNSCSNFTAATSEGV